MKWALPLLAFVGLAAGLQEKKKDPAPIPGWNPDIEAGLEEARRTGKPAFLVFR